MTAAVQDKVSAFQVAEGDMRRPAPMLEGFLIISSRVKYLKVSETHLELEARARCSQGGWLSVLLVIDREKNPVAAEALLNLCKHLEKEKGEESSFRLQVWGVGELDFVHSEVTNDERPNCLVFEVIGLRRVLSDPAKDPDGMVLWADGEVNKKDCFLLGGSHLESGLEDSKAPAGLKFSGASKALLKEKKLGGEFVRVCGHLNHSMSEEETTDSNGNVIPKHDSVSFIVQDVWSISTTPMKGRTVKRRSQGAAVFAGDYGSEEETVTNLPDDF